MEMKFCKFQGLYKELKLPKLWILIRNFLIYSYTKQLLISYVRFKISSKLRVCFPMFLKNTYTIKKTFLKKNIRHFIKFKVLLKSGKIPYTSTSWRCK